MNGNGEWGNGQGLANQLNNDANTNLTIRAIDGNRDALRELATNLNCDFNTLNSAICGIKGAIDKVGCDVGFSAERVINAIQIGDSNIISKMQDCCCTTQRSIDAVNLNLTKMSYEDQLAVQAQTNQLMTAINNGFCNVGQQIGNQTVAMQAGFQGIKDLFTQQKQLYEKYNDLFQSVKGNSQENVTEEKYKELIARIAELEEQLKEKEQPKE